MMGNKSLICKNIISTYGLVGNFESKRLQYFISVLEYRKLVFSKKCKTLSKIGARHLKIVLFWHNTEDINALQCNNTHCYIKIGII